MKGWYKYGQELMDEMKNTVLPEGFLAIWYLGQAGIVIKSGAKLACIDPYLREKPSRRLDPPFSPEDAADLFDYVFCTHNHEDHLDDAAIRRMVKTGKRTCYVVPAPHRDVMLELGTDPAQLLLAKAYESVELDGFSVTPVPAAHEEFEYDSEGNHHHLGYILKFREASLYHSGDTIEWESMVRDLSAFSMDIMCLPINGSDWKRKHENIIGNLNAREAADIADQCGADLVIPIHFDMFEGNGENPGYFAEYMYREHSGHKYHIMVPGERFLYTSR